MIFKTIPAQYFANLNSIDDFNSYVDVLVLLDDLLCMYDLVPRYPGYLPSGIAPELAGTPGLLSEAMQKCVDSIASGYLRSNLNQNIETALTLYHQRDEKRIEIFDFLVELVRQYSDMVHPAVYPGGAR